MKVDIPNILLTRTIEAMRDYQLRLEVEGSALAGLPGVIPRQLAEKRLEQAKTIEELFEFYIQL